jgi:hypothetical protein
MNLDRIVNLDATSTPTDLKNNAKRNYAVTCCALWCPSVAGDPAHDFVTQGRHAWPKYSSCGDQWNTLPWMMGCTDPGMINRDDAETGLRWQVQVNISKTLTGAKANGSWRPYVSASSVEAIPQPGDMLFIGHYDKGELEHVCVVEELTFDEESGATLLRTFDFGQFAEGKKCSLRVEREWRKGRVYSKSGASRGVIGWVDITAVPLARYAVDLQTFVP